MRWRCAEILWEMRWRCAKDWAMRSMRSMRGDARRCAGDARKLSASPAHFRALSASPRFCLSISASPAQFRRCAGIALGDARRCAQRISRASPLNSNARRCAGEMRWRCARLSGNFASKICHAPEILPPLPQKVHRNPSPSKSGITSSGFRAHLPRISAHRRASPKDFERTSSASPAR